MKNWFQKPIALIIFGLIVVAVCSYSYYAGKNSTSASSPVKSESKENTASPKASNATTSSETSNTAASSNAASAATSSKASNATTSSKSSGTNNIVTTPKSDIDPNLRQYLMSDDEMAASLKAFQQSNGSSKASSSNGVQSAASSGSKTSSTGYTPIQFCPYCYGTGKCKSCNGSGINPIDYGGGRSSCPICNGTGICKYCNGTGKKQ